MMNLGLVAAAICAASLISCRNPAKEQLSKLAWLEGSWEGVSGETVMREKWNKVNDALMTGSAHVLVEKDTVFSERIRIMAVDTSVLYVVFIPGVPDSTSFALTSYENDEAVFENPDHDFPKRIVYRKVGSDSLYAYIEGPVDGEVKREVFPYKRIASPQKN